MNNQLTNRNVHSHICQEDTIWIKGTDGITIIEVSNILFCKSCNVSTEIYTKYPIDNKFKHTSSVCIKDWELELTVNGFYRGHNEYLINLKHIEKYSVKRDGGGIVKLNTGIEIPISRGRKKEFEKVLNMYFKRTM